MSMTSLECFIDYYLAHYEQKLYSGDDFEHDVLAVLQDFSTTLDYLALHQDSFNSKLVDSMLEKWYE